MWSRSIPVHERTERIFFSCILHVWALHSRGISTLSLVLCIHALYACCMAFLKLCTFASVAPLQAWHLDPGLMRVVCGRHRPKASIFDRLKRTLSQSLLNISSQCGRAPPSATLFAPIPGNSRLPEWSTAHERDAKCRPLRGISSLGGIPASGFQVTMCHRRRRLSPERRCRLLLFGH